MDWLAALSLASLSVYLFFFFSRSPSSPSRGEPSGFWLSQPFSLLRSVVRDFGVSGDFTPTAAGLRSRVGTIPGVHICISTSSAVPYDAGLLPDGRPGASVWGDRRSGPCHPLGQRPAPSPYLGGNSGGLGVRRSSTHLFFLLNNLRFFFFCCS